MNNFAEAFTEVLDASMINLGDTLVEWLNDDEDAALAVIEACSSSDVEATFSEVMHDPYFQQFIKNKIAELMAEVREATSEDDE